MTVTQSRYSPGQVTWSVPAGATNVSFTIAAGSGGGSKSPSDGSLWNHSRGGFGRLVTSLSHQEVVHTI